MLLEDAIALRIEQLCIERNMTKYSLFEKSGVPQSTLTSIKKKRSRSVKMKTLYAICEGFDISPSGANRKSFIVLHFGQITHPSVMTILPALRSFRNRLAPCS